MALQDVANLLKNLGFAASDIVNALFSAFTTGVTEVATALKNIGMAAADCGQSIASFLGKTDLGSRCLISSADFRTVESLFAAEAARAAGFAVDVVATVLKKMPTAWLRKRPRMSSAKSDTPYPDIETALGDVFGLVGSALSDALGDVENFLGGLGDDIGDFLGSIF